MIPALLSHDQGWSGELQIDWFDALCGCMIQVNRILKLSLRPVDLVLGRIGLIKNIEYCFLG